MTNHGGEGWVIIRYPSKNLTYLAVLLEALEIPGAHLTERFKGIGDAKA